MNYTQNNLKYTTADSCSVAWPFGEFNLDDGESVDTLARYDKTVSPIVLTPLASVGTFSWPSSGATPYYTKTITAPGATTVRLVTGTVDLDTCSDTLVLSNGPTTSVRSGTQLSNGSLNNMEIGGPSESLFGPSVTVSVYSDASKCGGTCTCGASHAGAGLTITQAVYGTTGNTTNLVQGLPGMQVNSNNLSANWHRYYDAGVGGAYVSAEPMRRSPAMMYGSAQNGVGLAPYGYAGGNPMLYTDPDGLSSTADGVRAAAGACAIPGLGPELCAAAIAVAGGYLIWQGCKAIWHAGTAVVEMSRPKYCNNKCVRLGSAGKHNGSKLFGLRYPGNKNSDGSTMRPDECKTECELRGFSNFECN
jgi:hypothetical protein